MASLAVVALAATAASSAGCSLEGYWFPQLTEAGAFRAGGPINISRTSEGVYNVSGSEWTFAYLETGPHGSVNGTFAYADGRIVRQPAVYDGACGFIDWLEQGPSWCAADSNPACDVALAPFWDGGSIMLLEEAHSDILWLGKQNDMLVDAELIQQAMGLVAQNPGFAWEHECVLFLRAFLAFYPDLEDDLVDMMRNGTMDIGGTFTEPFEETLYGELLVRQVYSGRKWFIERYPDLANVAALTAFHQDGPLRALQMPQIYSRAGIRYLKASRLSDRIFRWASPDGSSLLAFEEVHYGEERADGGGYAQPLTPNGIARRMNQWAPRYARAGLPRVFGGTLGTDYRNASIQDTFTAAWAQTGFNVSVGYGTFARFLSALDTPQSRIPVLSGELPNMWWAEASPTHHFMFDDVRQAARSLPAAEMWSTLLSFVLESGKAGSYPYPSDRLAAAWLNMTLSDHGIGHEETPTNTPDALPWLVNEKSPPFADKVYQEKWSLARQTGDALVAEALGAIADGIDVPDAAEGNETLIVVFNSLSWRVTAPVECALPPALANTLVVLRDAATGQPVASQRNASDMSRLAFVAADVPSIGYRTYIATPGKEAPVASRDPEPWASPFENDFFVVTPGKGGVRSIIDKTLNRTELLNTSVYMAGEWMSLEYTSNGASETRTYGFDDRIPHRNPDTFERLGQFDAAWSTVESGPVRTVFRTTPARTAHSQVTLELVVWEKVKRLDFRLELRDWDSANGVANRLVFPLAKGTTASEQRNVSFSVPFGVVHVGIDEISLGSGDGSDFHQPEWMIKPGGNLSKFERGWAMRPRELQDWIHAEAAGAGVTLSSSVGVFDWIDASGEYGRDMTVLSPELLMHTDSNQGPFLNESGDHFFTFSLLSDAPGWKRTWRGSVQANHKLEPVVLPASAGRRRTRPSFSLPPTFGFVNVSDAATGRESDALWISALKKEDSGDGLIIRLFDAQGYGSNETRIDLAADVRGASSTNIIEHNATAAEAAAAAVRAIEPRAVGLRVAPWAIETLRVEL